MTIKTANSNRKIVVKSPEKGMSVQEPPAQAGNLRMMAVSCNLNSKLIRFPGSGKADLTSNSTNRNLVTILDQMTTNQPWLVTD